MWGQFLNALSVRSLKLCMATTTEQCRFIPASMALTHCQGHRSWEKQQQTSNANTQRKTVIIYSFACEKWGACNLFCITISELGMSSRLITKLIRNTQDRWHYCIQLMMGVWVLKFSPVWLFCEQQAKQPQHLKSFTLETTQKQWGEDIV